jgi:hypothetical protein
MISKAIILFITLAFCAILQHSGREESANSRSDTTSLTTDTQSSSFATTSDALEFLERYLKLPTPVDDTAYHIIYQDNSQGFPGPSDWDMHIALKVKPEHIKSWLEGYEISDEPFDITWGYDVAKARGWTLTTAPEFYTSAGTQVAIFSSDGVIFKRLTTF